MEKEEIIILLKERFKPYWNGFEDGKDQFNKGLQTAIDIIERIL